MKKTKSFQRKVIAITPILCVFTYLLIGFVWHIWHPTWLIFFLIPIMPILVGTKAIRLSVPLIATVIFLVLGFCFNLWHPGWLVFLLVPVFEIIFNGEGIAIVINGKCKDKCNDEKEKDDNVIEIEEKD